MRLLLDTHTLLWASLSDARLSAKARELLNQSGHTFYVSAVSPWEIATKYRKGQLPEAGTLLRGFDAMVQGAGFKLLSISCEHGLRAGSFLQPHKDPFDRMLIAQALVENLVLLSADSALDAFEVKRLW